TPAGWPAPAASCRQWYRTITFQQAAPLRELRLTRFTSTEELDNHFAVRCKAFKRSDPAVGGRFVDDPHGSDGLGVQVQIEMRLQNIEPGSRTPQRLHRARMDLDHAVIADEAHEGDVIPCHIIKHAF